MKCNKLIICGFTKIYLYRFLIHSWVNSICKCRTNNPGPGIVDPTKTIASPYSQGYVEVFVTANVATQRVAMSLSALNLQ